MILFSLGEIPCSKKLSVQLGRRSYISRRFLRPHRAGVLLKDLATHSDGPTSSWAALRLLLDRRSYPGANEEYRNVYE